MKKYLPVFLLAILLSGCDNGYTGTTTSAAPPKIKFINSSKKTFNVYIDGSVVGSVSPKSSTTFGTYPGTHSLKAVEEVGGGWASVYGKPALPLWREKQLIGYFLKN